MKLNAHIASLPAGYLFAEIGKRVKAYQTAHPGADLIRLGIGDVTRPIAPSVARVFADAALKMGTRKDSTGTRPTTDTIS